MTDYTVEYSRRRTITLSIKPDRTVVVKAPHLVPRLIIDQFVAKHREWIEGRLAKLSTKPHLGTGTYQDGDVFLYLGKEVTLTYGNFATIKVSGNTLQVPLGLKFRVQKEIASWYMAQGKALITKQLEKFAEEMETSYTRLSFSDTKSKWGSCSHLNELQFNWRLIMAPPLVLNYVVIHELAHTTEKNHSRSFWSRVGYFNPSYRQNRKWLKENGHTLVF